VKTILLFTLFSFTIQAQWKLESVAIGSMFIDYAQTMKYSHGGKWNDGAKERNFLLGKKPGAFRLTASVAVGSALHVYLISKSPKEMRPFLQFITIFAEAMVVLNNYQDRKEFKK
jgi:hypothetical protein